MPTVTDANAELAGGLKPITAANVREAIAMISDPANLVARDNIPQEKVIACKGLAGYAVAALVDVFCLNKKALGRGNLFYTAQHDGTPAIGGAPVVEFADYVRTNGEALIEPAIAAHQDKIDTAPGGSKYLTGL